MQWTALHVQSWCSYWVERKCTCDLDHTTYMCVGMCTNAQLLFRLVFYESVKWQCGSLRKLCFSCPFGSDN
jgi:hypothetical protein